MDLIYTQATGVYSCIASTSHYKDLFRWLLSATPKAKPWESFSPAEQIALLDLERLFSLRYFTRVWVKPPMYELRVRHTLTSSIDILGNPRSCPSADCVLTCER
jgi:hypothetical protein